MITGKIVFQKDGIIITYNPGRIQPFTVWRAGFIERFATNMEEALLYKDTVLRRAI